MVLINITGEKLKPYFIKDIPDTVPVITSSGEIESITDDPVGFIIISRDAKKTHPLLGYLLAHDKYYYLPIWIIGKITPLEETLSEGEFSDWNTSRTVSEHIKSMARLVPGLENADQDQKLLTYMYVRDNFVLKPIFKPGTMQLYAYPLLTVFSEDTAMVNQWRYSLEDRKLIQKDAIRDRIRLCPKCHSVRMNYIDTCTNCGSIAIEKKNFYHCFTCGNVDQEKAFQKSGILQCPNCRSNLRHIGVDYDRTLDDYQCRDCNAIFTDPYIEAQCYDCDYKDDPGSLEVREIYTYTLSQDGRLAVRTGQLKEMFSILDSFDFCSKKYFCSNLSWSLKLWEREKVLDFSLLVVKLHNIRKKTLSEGETSVSLFIEEIIQQLRNNMRTTDLVTRISEDTIGMYLPLTPAKNLKIITSRLEDTNQKAASKNNSEPTLLWSSFSVKTDWKKGYTSEEIMGELLGKIDDKAHG
ncbi:diguanylate cyclase domain-containing protein [Chitinivibrio alkaliphilus]|uniref:GGDEF domain-containing protein n=1 Tax=Chitinivibrio alkaliphilus ACht1 TaxID=1313304 RepID=U7D6H7_9BACT|nr:diguanylate cyclase [Chitinivibrio alkaliphilus]ERP30692.1 hypothetical protein CALK_2487 [Chitinivibrio alkaliphilus ACht1]